MGRPVQSHKTGRQDYFSNRRHNSQTLQHIIGTTDCKNDHDLTQDMDNRAKLRIPQNQKNNSPQSNNDVGTKI